MDAAARKQQKTYWTTQVTTASGEKLVLLLFDGIVRFCEAARQAYSAQPVQFEAGGQAIQRAQAVVMELLYTLNREKGGEVAENLARLHAYAFKCLIQANMARDVEKLNEVVFMYSGLRAAWSQAMGSLGSSGQAAPAAAGGGAAPAATGAVDFNVQKPLADKPAASAPAVAAGYAGANAAAARRLAVQKTSGDGPAVTAGGQAVPEPSRPQPVKAVSPAVAPAMARPAHQVRAAAAYQRKPA